MIKNKEDQERDIISSPNGRKRKKWLRIIAIIMLIAISIWILCGNLIVQRTEIEIIDNKLPDSFNGYKIAHVSDLHNANFGRENAGLIKILDKNQPDIICITGDLIDSNHTNIDRAVAFVQKAALIAPCYYVTGNHEAWVDDYDELEKRLTEAGVIILHNQYLDLAKEDDSIRLIGIDDTDFRRAGQGLFDVEPLVNEFTDGNNSSEKNDYLTNDNFNNDDGINDNILNNNEKFSILLSHRPEMFDSYVRNGYNLVLTGHAHGGQFRIPFIGGLIAPSQGFFPKYDSGVYTEDNTKMVVSRGIGNSVIPVRINNNPEIIFITIKNK